MCIYINCTETVASSLAVISILAMTTVSSSLKCSPNSSQMGASFLQWPHLAREYLKDGGGSHQSTYFCIFDVIWGILVIRTKELVKLMLWGIIITKELVMMMLGGMIFTKERRTRQRHPCPQPSPRRQNWNWQEPLDISFYHPKKRI